MKLTRHFVEKPWGRTDLPSAFAAPDGKRIGEIWYESDESPTLPLLVKWLFTSEKLSIQVHPTDAQAAARGLPSGKEECWYIVDAEPGAVLGIGTKRPLDAAELRAASLSGEIEDLIDWKPVRAGDYFYIPAGTVHAIGAGITLVEVQQYADVTYRLFDYGRPRELHLDDGVAVSRAEPYGDPRSGHIAPDVYLADGPVFWLRSLATRSYSRSDFASGRCWLIPVQGKVYCDDQVVEIGECMVTSAFDAIIVDDAAICLIAGA
ncbi:MAG: class I mannose-6-phosphate isomerase [Sphingorhabdus sp.]|jgi:mannose-6-phosphate isomerase